MTAQSALWEMVTVVNCGTSAGLAMLAGWAAMSPRVRDGIVIKLGLISISLGQAVTAVLLANGLAHVDLLALDRARFACNAGLAVVLSGYWIRRLRGQRLHDVLPEFASGPPAPADQSQQPTKERF